MHTKARTAVKLDIQLRTQRYIEWSVTLIRKLSKFRCKVGFVKNLFYNIEKTNPKNYLLFLVAYLLSEDASCLFTCMFIASRRLINVKENKRKRHI